MALGGTYNTGLLTVANGSETVSGQGVLWLDVEEGDWLQVGTAVAVINSVDESNTIITLEDVWPGASSPVVTMTIANPGVVTLDNHGFVANQPIAFTTTGALPGGLTASVTYYVSETGLGTNNFEIATAINGSSINFTGTQSGVQTAAQAYRILKMSWLRYDPSLTQQKLREFITNIEAAGIFLFVTGSTPDPSMGEDGQWALKVNSGPWQLWLNVEGTWVEQGSPTGLNWVTGGWSSTHTYNQNDATSFEGVSYISLQGNNLDNSPATSPSYWDVLAVGGERYDVAAWASDRPDSDETILQMVLTTTVVFDAGLAQSAAVCGTAATASAVFSLEKNGSQFGTITFGIGSGTGTFAAASNTTFNAGDVLSVVTPNPRDATLANIALTITGFR